MMPQARMVWVDRASQVFCQLPDRISRIGPFGTVAAVNVDQIGIDQHPRGLANGGRIRGQRFHEPVPGRIDDGHRLGIPLPGDDVFRDQDVDRTGPTGHGDAEGVPHHVGYARPVLDLAAPFDRRFKYVQVVADLHAAQVDVSIGDIAAPRGRNGHDRTAFGLGTHHPGHQIGRPRGRRRP